MDNCDFSGYATRNDLLCGDGVTIRKDAFKGNDGCEVPLVWNHEHNDPNAVLGMQFWKIVTMAYMPTVYSITLNRVRLLRNLCRMEM